MVKYLGQQEAVNLGMELSNEYKFADEQITELSGLSCATAIAKTYPLQSLTKKFILVCCGSGCNGGDGLVCARHLKYFNYIPVIYYPKQNDSTFHRNLAIQCNKMGIPFLDKLPTLHEINDDFALIIDALFGYSFKAPVRQTFVPTMQMLKETKVPIVSLDIPSGWDVQQGEPKEGGIKPQLLISLSAPKICAKYFKGVYHYLGGRYIPQMLAQKHELNLPAFPGTDCVVLLK